MSDPFALTDLYDRVVARFADEATPATHYFGWRASTQQKPGATIVWMPGDPSGALGAIGSARKPGRDPRPIATLHELFTVEITGVDTSLEDERKQYAATRLLFDAWYRAVYLAARGTFVVASTQWAKDRTQRPYGATLRVVGTVESMIPDLTPTVVATSPTSAEIPTDPLDGQQTVLVPDEDA